MKMHEDIAKKAYELFEKSGRVHGRDVEHWCEAEKMLLSKTKAPKKSATAKKAATAGPAKKRTVKRRPRA
ncbi:MAG: hypothetical protein BMS9Abin23_0548 [Thermodesulfobacteriota bacterium]|nr:MAG: hypothetical protein BMS9Abin23_0548 [Thermodesulfobacteriota bacterium]